MSLFRFSLICPRCDKQSETTATASVPAPRVNCGDCLMDRCEVVEFKVVAVQESTIYGKA